MEMISFTEAAEEILFMGEVMMISSSAQMAMTKSMETSKAMVWPATIL